MSRKIPISKITYHDGKWIVTKNKEIYLGVQVEDIPPPGYSHLKEVRSVLREIYEDYIMLLRIVNKKRVLKTVDRRIRAVWKKIKQSKVMPKEKKKRARELINRLRVKIGLRVI